MKKRFVALLLTLFLFVPALPAAGALHHTVEAGDTMNKIAYQYGMSLTALAVANPQVTNIDMIHVGQSIFIPDTIPLGIRESLSYLYAGNTVSYMKAVLNAKRSLHTVCPDYFDLDYEGKLLITPPHKIDTVFIKEMHRQGLLVTPFLSNHWDYEKAVAALANREALASQIAAKIAEYDMDGVNVDIENVEEDWRSSYTDFVRLLREKLPQDKLVTVAVAANPGGRTVGWHASYDYKALSNYADYLMVMSYDESYYTSEPGPVSSAQFFETSIQYAVNQGVPKSKIVMGLPFYGRYWKAGDSVGGYGIVNTDIEYLIQKYQSNVRYDSATQSCEVEITILPGEPEPKLWGGKTLTAGKYTMWYDNAPATRYKLSLIDSYGLRGAGSWALGQEDVAIWDDYTALLNSGKQPTPPPEPEPEPEPAPVPPIPAVRPNVQKILDCINGKGGRTVTPAMVLTRAEAAVALCGITNVFPETGESFADTQKHWAKGYLNAFRRRGIVTGDQNLFYPDRAITRQELMAIFDRLLVLPNTIDYHVEPFKDVTPNMWSYNAISKMRFFGVINGTSATTFTPHGTITIDTMANILDNIDRFGYDMNPNRLIDPFSETISKAGRNIGPTPIPEPVIEPR